MENVNLLHEFVLVCGIVVTLIILLLLAKKQNGYLHQRLILLFFFAILLLFLFHYAAYHKIYWLYTSTRDTKRITVHHLLTHSSGIPDIFTINKIQEIEESQIDTWYDYFPFFEDDKLDFTPGKKWSYSNSGFLVLGKIIEIISGQDYSTFLTENIFKKAAMSDLNSGFPAGGSWATMQHLLSFSEALQAYELLNESSTKSAMADKIKIEKDVYYGYGFQVYKRYKSLEVSHKGGTDQSKAQLLMFTETGYTVIIYGNNNDIGYDGFNEARHYLREVLT